MRIISMEIRSELYAQISALYDLKHWERDRLDASGETLETALQLAYLQDWDRLAGVVCELKGPRGEWIHSCGHAHEPHEGCPESPCGKYICCIN